MKFVPFLNSDLEMLVCCGTWRQ